MYKKFFLGCMIMFALMVLTACESNVKRLVLANMSEVTQEYYYGQNDDIYATLSLGERESEFLYNGTSTENVDYVLLSIDFKNGAKYDAITVYLSSNDANITVELTYKESNDTYVADIVGMLEIVDYVDLTYEGNKIRLEKYDFVISSDEAIEIATNYLYDTLETYKSYNNFYAECYLVVLSMDNFDDIYWCFTCLGYDSNSVSIIISAADGTVISE